MTGHGNIVLFQSWWCRNDPEADVKRWITYISLIVCPFICAAYSGAAEKGWESANGIYAVIDTNMGTIVALLFDKETPRTVANFVGLAEGTKEFTDMKTGQKVKKPFFDGLIFHRVVPDVMIQSGCPMGVGIGGPGYTFEDEFADTLMFDQPGMLAMSNSGPNTNGSQFFITESAAPWLNGKHTIFGRVVQGLEIAVKISRVECEKSGKATTSTPAMPVVIKTVTIKRIGKEYEKPKPKPARKIVNAEPEKPVKKDKTGPWAADFSADGIANWQCYGTGASISSSGGNLVLSLSASSWDAGGVIPISSMVQMVPVGAAKNFNFNIVSKTEALTYDIALDEFNSEGTYLASKWNVVANPGPTGAGSISLVDLSYDAGTEFVLPKINAHTTDINQSITIGSLDFGPGKGTPKPSPAIAKPASVEKAAPEITKKAVNPAAWSADFSSDGIADWLTYGAGATVSASNGKMVIHSTENSWDAGGAYPNNAQVKQIPVATAKKLNYSVKDKTDSLTYDIALDEFNAQGVYVGTKWNVVANPGPVGSGSVSLSGLTYDPGTQTVLPKINIHTTATNQSITVTSLSVSE